MLKKLINHGNSKAIVIPKAILELLDIEAETTLKVKTDGESLIMTPVREKPITQKALKAVK